jgi:DNA-binding response OmpR family regulator
MREKESRLEQSPARILVVDDDPDTCALMADILLEEGYDVVTCSRGEEAMEIVSEDKFDLVLSDIKMPRVSGIELLSYVRKKNLETEVILITAYASVETAVQALRDEAFDYLTKPFSLPEFRERVRQALLPRTGTGRRHIVNHYRGLSLDYNTRRVWVEGEEVKLTRLEFQVLAYLLEHKGEVVPWQDLLKHVWMCEEPDERSQATIKSCISRLRKKIEKDPQNPVYIINEWGVGYRVGE